MPKGDEKWIIENGRVMYKELSKETDEFFSFMLENNLMDLVAKRAKQAEATVRLLKNTKRRLFFKF